MGIDRTSALKQAEKLLRQGKLDGAIAEYVRLVEDQPQDWNSINALGDLYARAGKGDRAVEQYIRVADHLFNEGFLPKASAHYKKALKLKGNDEHLTLRLAEIAAQLGLLVDARMYLRQLSAQRRGRGDERGALDCVVRLGVLEDADPESQMAGGRASEELGDVARAVQLFQAAAEALEKRGQQGEALEALAEAARLAPGDHELGRSIAKRCIDAGQPERAATFLTRDAAGDDPDLLLMLGRAQLAAGRAPDARVSLTRFLTLAPDRRPDVALLAGETARSGDVETAYGCAELVVDDAVLAGDWEAAIAALRTFVERASYIPALIKLVEIAVDAGDDETLREAQARLADAYVEAGQAAEARVIAEDLVAFDPRSDQHVARLRRVIEIAGGEDADEVIARYREPEPEPERAEPPEPSRVAPGEGVTIEARDEMDLDPAVVTRSVTGDEVDLSELLASLAVTAPPAGLLPAPDLDEVFAKLRGRVGNDQRVGEALDRFQRAIANLEGGREEPAIADLEAAARAPLLRFAAAARLGRLHLTRGELQPAIEWLERAAAAPAPDADEARAVLYELASALQATGEGARALAVLMEIDAERTEYRDVSQRIEQLRTAERT